LFNTAVGIYAGSLLFFLVKRSRTALWLLGTGFLLHTVSQVFRCWRWGIFSLDGVFNSSYFLPWCLALLALLCLAGKRPRESASLTVPTALFGLLALALPVRISPPSPFTATITSPLFFLFEVLAIACFLASGWFAWRYLRGRGDAALFNQLAIWGFIAYSLAQVAGAAWSYLGWASPFHWGERHLQSAGIWCLYCGYLHTHFDRGFDVRKKARWALTGALVVLVFGYVLQAVSHLEWLTAKAGAKRGPSRQAVQRTVEPVALPAVPGRAAKGEVSR
jgi:ABC-type transport system involved in cytochrome c biogenesis permease subunit